MIVAKSAILWTLCLIGVGTSATLAQDLVLPDLVTRECDLNRYAQEYDSGTVYLRLPNAVGNIGPGELRVLGPGPGTLRDAFQRVMVSGGGTEDYLIGSFEWHDTLGHDHFHFANLAEYRLHEIIAGDGVAPIPLRSAPKTGFCLVDVDNGLCTGTHTGGVFEETGCCENDPNCPLIVEGISVGWYDVYDLDILDQRIDVTGVPSGGYWLVSEANPESTILEQTRANNIAKQKVVIIQSEDSYEPNDTKAEVDTRTVGDLFSPNLGSAGFPYIIQGLSIHQEVLPSLEYIPDADYFRFHMNGTGLSNHFAEIEFANEWGDLNLELLDSSGLPLNPPRSSLSPNFDTARVSLENLPCGWYYLRVFAPLKTSLESEGIHETNFDYQLTINAPAYACGDVNGDGVINTADVITLNISQYCQGQDAISCPGNADFNGDGMIDCSDRDDLVSYIFLGTPKPNCP